MRSYLLLQVNDVDVESINFKILWFSYRMSVCNVHAPCALGMNARMHEEGINSVPIVRRTVVVIDHISFLILIFNCYLGSIKEL